MKKLWLILSLLLTLQVSAQNLWEFSIGILPPVSSLNVWENKHDHDFYAYGFLDNDAEPSLNPLNIRTQFNKHLTFQYEIHSLNRYFSTSRYPSKNLPKVAESYTHLNNEPDRSWSQKSWIHLGSLGLLSDTNQVFKGLFLNLEGGLSFGVEKLVGRTKTRKTRGSSGLETKSDNPSFGHNIGIVRELYVLDFYQLNSTRKFAGPWVGATFTINRIQFYVNYRAHYFSPMIYRIESLSYFKGKSVLYDSYTYKYRTGWLTSFHIGLRANIFSPKRND